MSEIPEIPDDFGENENSELEGYIRDALNGKISDEDIDPSVNEAIYELQEIFERLQHLWGLADRELHFNLQISPFPFEHGQSVLERADNASMKAQEYTNQAQQYLSGALANITGALSVYQKLGLAESITRVVDVSYMQTVLQDAIRNCMVAQAQMEQVLMQARIQHQWLQNSKDEPGS